MKFKKGDNVECMNDVIHASYYKNKPKKGCIYKVRGIVFDEVLLHGINNEANSMLGREAGFHHSRFKKAKD
jgi:hypothetical protein